MAYFHKNLTQERWDSFTKDKQILNIASELTRAKNRLKEKDEQYMQNSLDRALELIDLTIADNKKWHGGSLKELLRLREVLGEFYVGINKNVSEFVKLIRVLLNFNKITFVVEI